MDKGGVAAAPGRAAPWRVALRTVGELLITLSLLLFLFCAYQLFYTNVVADRAMDSEVSDLHRSWAQTAAPTPRSLSGAVTPFDTADTAGHEGAAFAILHIPRIGATAIPVIEGTSLDVLGRGVDHYTGSAMPGQVGNFALAGHRKTHGEPFRRLDAVRAGLAVMLETAATWHPYQVDRDAHLVHSTDVR